MQEFIKKLPLLIKVHFRRVSFQSELIVNNLRMYLNESSIYKIEIHMGFPALYKSSSIWFVDSLIEGAFYSAQFWKAESRDIWWYFHKTKERGQSSSRIVKAVKKWQ